VAGDPINGVRNGDPHAFTVPYDIEAFWVLDDRDSVWSDLAPDARATFPKHGGVPGVDDEFHINLGQNGFFAFNDFNPDYFYVTGVPVQAHVPAGIGLIDPAGPPPVGGGLPNGLIPPALNSGKAGTQIAINARVGQTVLIRVLDSAYVDTRITFPVDAVVIAFDGRALGVPPFGLYNAPFLLKAGTPIEISTARRFDVLIRTTAAINAFATVDFLNTRGGALLVTAQIPFVVA
jgi:hypothetical protein